MGRSLMEVGLGHGGYRNYLPQIDSYIGVDIDKDCIENAQQRFPHDQFLCADITSRRFVESAAGLAVDSVLCANVLEHIKQDRLAVEQLTKALKIGGYLLIFVPAFEFLYAPMDELAGHLRRYNTDQLQQILQGDNREIVTMRYFNALGGLGWWVNKFLPHRSLDSNSVNTQIKIFDKLGVPVAKLCDFGTNRYFGQSVFAICRRRK